MTRLGKGDSKTRCGESRSNHKPNSNRLLFQKAQQPQWDSCQTSYSTKSRDSCSDGKAILLPTELQSFPSQRRCAVWSQCVLGREWEKGCCLLTFTSIALRMNTSTQFISHSAARLQWLKLLPHQYPTLPNSLLFYLIWQPTTQKSAHEIPQSGRLRVQYGALCIAHGIQKYQEQEDLCLSWLTGRYCRIHQELAIFKKHQDKTTPLGSDFSLLQQFYMAVHQIGRAHV